MSVTEGVEEKDNLCVVCEIERVLRNVIFTGNIILIISCNRMQCSSLLLHFEYVQDLRILGKMYLSLSISMFVRIIKLLSQLCEPLLPSKQEY